MMADKSPIIVLVYVGLCASLVVWSVLFLADPLSLSLQLLEPRLLCCLTSFAIAILAALEPLDHMMQNVGFAKFEIDCVCFCFLCSVSSCGLGIERCLVP